MIGQSVERQERLLEPDEVGPDCQLLVMQGFLVVLRDA
jgi:hypothetical protein